jgi:hypothetical protein
MNQKSITNQILTRELSLNSTLNYLFNISNMKKLFTYLLISSMVVLSSCTNYDDQFDDLNSQLSTLKTQIEGFTALSSGVTALQGTVTSLQAAVAALPKTTTPATDISGLQAALTSLAATVAELKTSLATAATAADVAALTASLTKVQTDLSELLASNNVFTGTLTINSASTLTAAEALGDKISIVSGSVIVDQLSTAVDAARLQAVVSKIVTVTGALTYTQTGTGVTAVNFTKLTGVGALTLDQEAAISLPVLASAAAVVLTSDAKVTSVSAPLLVTVATINDLNFSGATEINLASLKYQTASKSLSITAKTGATLDMSSYTTVDPVTLVQSTLYSLALVGPKVVTLPLFESGALTTDAETLTLVKMIAAPSVNAAKLKEIHMHNLQGAILLSSYTKLSIVDIIGTYLTTGTASVVAGPRATKVTMTGATGLDKLTLAGALGDVSIAGATSLTDVTTSGGMSSFSLTGATDLTSLTLGHGPNASSTLKRSDLTITGATALTSLTADSVNNATALNISGNTELTKISLAALKALSTEASQSVVVNIAGNKLEVQSVQLASATGQTPVVAGKVTTNSGVTALKTWLDLAIGGVNAAGESVTVNFNNTVEIVDAAGAKYNANTTVKEKTTSIGTGNSVTISTVANTDWSFINVTNGTAAPASVKQVQSVVIPVLTEGDGYSDIAVANGENIRIVAGGLTKNFAAGTTSTTYATVTALAAAIAATDFGTGVSVTTARDAYGVSYNKINYTTPAGVASTVAGAPAGSNSATVFLGTFSSTFALSTSGMTSDALAIAVAAKLDGQASGGKKYSVTAATTNGVIKVTRLMTGTTNVDFGGNTSFPAISILNTNTAGYYKWSANASNTVGLSSDYNLAVRQDVVNGLRITFTNNSFAVALTSDSATATLTAPGSAFTAKTDLVSGTNHHSDTAVSVPFSQASDNSQGGSNGNATDATAWL